MIKIDNAITAITSIIKSAIYQCLIDVLFDIRIVPLDAIVPLSSFLYIFHSTATLDNGNSKILSILD